jgi:hypothetical protein
MTLAFDAVVLAGDRSRRLGGADKPMLTVGGRTLLDRACGVLIAAGAERVMVVGPERGTLPAACAWVAEQSEGDGPAAATIAGVRALKGDPLVVVMAADLPMVGPVIGPLVDAAARGVDEGLDGAMVRADGRDQYLVHCARRSSLLRVVGDGDPTGWPMRRLVEGMDLVPVVVPPDHVLDTDTWDAVARARRELGGAMDLMEWAERACALAAVDGAPIDADAILELARDAAHGVARPAAPVSTFILGYAAAARGLDAADIAQLAAELGRAARGD